MASPPSPRRSRPVVAEAPAPSARDAILIAGARTHNLKDVSVAIPRGRLTVVTGVSGSGKSSLAFDTLYAEGQRRYVESMSTYARQFLERMPRPDVDSVTGVPPAIALEQRNGVKNARSTVGTATEIADYLRLLFAKVGEVRCPTCGGGLAHDTASRAARRLLDDAAGRRVQIAAPLGRAVSTLSPALRAQLLRDGHHRLLVAASAPETAPSVVRLDDAEALAAHADDECALLVDRLAIGEGESARLAQAIETAFRLADGRAEVHVEGGALVRLDEKYRCAGCGRELARPEPTLFSYNSPLGACPACQGFGRAIGLDLDKVIPDGSKSIREGAIAPFQTPSNRECQEDLERAMKRKKLPLDVPWRALDPAARAFVLDGEGDGKDAWKQGKWYGVHGFFRWLESKKYKMHVRVLLARYRGYEPCLVCEGTRLRPEARAVLVGGRSIAALEAMPVGQLRPLLAEAGRALPPQRRATAELLLGEIDARLGYLVDVGLEYLTLIRPMRTLSGGEAQRIALASALGARLTGTLYVLDEPSVGLHPRDSQRLLAVLRRLTDRGNTVVLVEHDPEIIAAADHVIDLGPGAGARGGTLLYAGPVAGLVDATRHSPAGRGAGAEDRRLSSETGRTLRERSLPYGEAAALPRSPGAIRIVGARAHNLRDLTVEIPLGRLVAVTGVSGSGKSTLVGDVLYANFLRARGQPADDVGACDRLEGLELVSEVVLVDQTPLARSSRSNPATYLKCFDELRKLLAREAEARRLGLEAAAFSFNVAREAGGGRCEACAGQGAVTLEMHFLADVTVPCDACGGRRFGDKVLGVRLRGKNVNELLALTVDEALALFADEPRVTSRLRPFADVGLGYLTLGQSTATLSGGESQRLKLASHLDAPDSRARARGGSKLFLLDEPTTGLHAADVEVLVRALSRLVQAGHSVVVIEHNLDLVRAAHHVIDLGPDGGEAGGRLVASGPPAAIAADPSSHTGRALARAFGLGGGSAAAPTSPPRRGARLPT